MFYASHVDAVAEFMRSIGKIILAGFVLLPLLASCSSLTPHENFKNFLKNNVGKRADDPSSDVARYPQLLIDSQVLPNGNTENKYLWRGACRYFLEIDSITRKIVGWRFEGSEHDCEIVP